MKILSEYYSEDEDRCSEIYVDVFIPECQCYRTVMVRIN